MLGAMLVRIAIGLRRGCFDVEIGVEIVLPAIGGFRDEEDDKGEQYASEDGHKVKGPFPPDCIRDLPNKNRCKECTSEERKI